MSKSLDLSIIIVAPNQGISTHKSILSALHAAKDADFTYEIQVHYSLNNSEIVTYIENNQTFLSKNDIAVTVHEVVSTGVLRNEALQSAAGRHILFLNAGDLISKDYLKKALDSFKAAPTLVAALPSMLVSFFDASQVAPRVHSENSVFQSGLVDVSMAYGAIYSADFFKHYAFPAVSDPIYTSDIDQHAICELNAASKEVTLIAESYYFKRYSTLFDLLGLYNVRKQSLIPASSAATPSRLRPSLVEASVAGEITRKKSPGLKKQAVTFLESQPQLLHAVRTTIHHYRHLKKDGFSHLNKPTIAAHLPSSLLDTVLDLQSIEPKIYLQRTRKGHIVNPAAPEIKQRALFDEYYAEACKSLRSDHYDYILVVPWLIAGGADKFFVNYANMAAKIDPSKKVLIVSTAPSVKSLPSDMLGISEDVDFLRLSELIKADVDFTAHCAHLLLSIIENTSPRVLHVALSQAGFRTIIDHHTYLKEKNVKTIITAYNEVIDTYGRREGYVHEEIPLCYPYVDAVTTDNQMIIDMWCTEYGFSPKNIYLHHQPFHLPEKTHKDASPSDPIRILWASHVRKEKNPEAAVAVADAFARGPINVQIDCFGLVDRNHYPKNLFTSKSRPNLTYKGGFKNFFKDTKPETYDLFLYTSLHDGTPNIVIEAGLAKLPIISSAIGGIPTLLGDDASLIQHPTNADEFVAAVSNYHKDPMAALKKADHLHKRLLKTQTYTSFEKEVKDMLTSLGY
ncbi:MAG TPA: glycosyltransferase [Candidatus Saccharimonadales bacterium]|nr:glycosyltransferase [Candidatus Saccharimonadales bacterium]